MVWPPDTTTSTPRLSRILALPSPAATATKPSGLRSAGLLGRERVGACGALQLHVVDVDLRDLRSMIQNQPRTSSGRLVCTCTLKLGCMPTMRSQSPIVGRNSFAASASTSSEWTRNSVQ